MFFKTIVKGKRMSKFVSAGNIFKCLSYCPDAVWGNPGGCCLGARQSYKEVF